MISFSRNCYFFSILQNKFRTDYDFSRYVSQRRFLTRGFVRNLSGVEMAQIKSIKGLLKVGISEQMIADALEIPLEKVKNTISKIQKKEL